MTTRSLYKVRVYEVKLKSKWHARLHYIALTRKVTLDVSLRGATVPWKGGFVHSPSLHFVIVDYEVKKKKRWKETKITWCQNAWPTLGISLGLRAGCGVTMAWTRLRVLISQQPNMRRLFVAVGSKDESTSWEISTFICGTRARCDLVWGNSCHSIVKPFSLWESYKNWSS